MRGLDGVRGLAVLLVMLFHGQRTLAGEVVVPALDMGWVGVDLFFVLSGFLITGILRRTRDHPRAWRNFAVRRGLRILPPYYLLLALILLPRVLAGTELHSPWWVYPTFLSNFWIATRGGHDLALDVTWSLAVEEQFYLLWPLCVFALPRRGMVALCVVAMVGAPLLRMILHDPGSEVTYMWTPCRVDALAVGALAALAREGPSHPVAARVVGPIGLGGLALCFAALAVLGDVRSSFAWVAVGGSLFTMSAAAVLHGLAEGRLPRLVQALEWRPIAHLGTVSYSAYLLHGMWAVALAGRGLPWIAGVALLVALTWASSTLVWRTLEAPLLAWKDRIAAY